VERRRYGWRDVWRDLVPLVAVLLFAYGYVADTPTVADLRRVEVKDRNTQRTTAFRLCTRNKDDRAYAHARERGLAIKRKDGTWIKAVPMTPKERMRRRDFSRALMDTPLLPVLDCDPNVSGLGAVPMPVARQEAYMNDWRKRGLAPVEYGVCPKSAFGRPVYPDRC
jgi:hypothetical protein